MESDPARVNSVLVAALADARLRRLPKFREALMAWIQPVRAERNPDCRSAEQDDEGPD